MYTHTDSPVSAGKAHTRPVALRLETLCCPESSQCSSGGSHGGGGLMEGGGAIQGGSALEVLVLPSLETERFIRERGFCSMTMGLSQHVSRIISTVNPWFIIKTTQYGISSIL